MGQYKKILVAVDFADECKKVLDKATEIARLNSADIQLIHVVQPIANTYSAGLAGGFVSLETADLDQSLFKAAEEQLSKLGEANNIDTDNLHVVIGSPKDEIHRLAKDSNTDLVIIGSHGRHGVGLLLGSTANAVLHGANCDVLAVRV